VLHANFLEIATAKKFFENLPISDEVMCRAFGVHFFGLPCIGLDVVDVVFRQGRLSLSTDGDKCATVNFGRESIKSLILNFNIQQCEFCAQV